ncbi:MAG: hypothetical protein WC700_10280 [Gemmatimonadaceae bacterium]|jgi:hypothetical protein
MTIRTLLQLLHEGESLTLGCNKSMVTITAASVLRGRRKSTKKFLPYAQIGQFAGGDLVDIAIEQALDELRQEEER